MLGEDTGGGNILIQIMAEEHKVTTSMVIQAIQNEV